MKKILLTLVLALALAPLVAMAAPKAALPKGYEKWEKSRQLIDNDKKSLFYGIHYIYVNAKALPTYKSAGTKYPEGSQFVVDYYGIKDEGGKPVQGKKKMIVLMKKDKRFKQTGGWQFAGFTADRKPSDVDPVENCYECHAKSAKNTDLVISKYASFK